MARRQHSGTPSSPPPAKRLKLDHLTKESFKNGVVLAPMVRSGSLPTRLFALKHGASLVWSPEVVDKAILHATRVVNPKNGVISYNGKSGPIFTTHPIEKPYLIYQIGSADPDLAVQAAKTVVQDVSGIDLNCGCPKPFSTHAGMGAALLTNPDLLCSILTELRRAMPPEITVSAKIRLLPSQEDTLALVERIVNTGVSALTVHCRTRNMRPRERALIERLREIVDFVKKMGKGIAVIANGDCVGLRDAQRVRQTTGASSCMIATAAESNPSCFSLEPLLDVEKTLIPPYIRLGKYLENNFSNTKFCFMSFKAKNSTIAKDERVRFREILTRSKTYDDLNSAVQDIWDGDKVLEDVIRALEDRIEGQAPHVRNFFNATLTPTPEPTFMLPGTSSSAVHTPLETRPNPVPETLSTPRDPPNLRLAEIPAMISREDVATPTPTPHTIEF